MAANITFQDALESDLQTLVSIRCESLEEDILDRFLLSPRATEALRKQTESLTASLGARFTNPTNECYVIKTVDSTSGQIVGWSLVRWEDSKWLSAEPPHVAEPTFAQWYQRAVRGNWLRLAAGRAVVVLGAMYVKNDLRGTGIGRQMIEYLYKEYDLEKEIVVVQTNPLAEGFYSKLGWVTVDSTDVDLSQWGGEGRGYGTHRSPQMVREPTSAVPNAHIGAR